MSEKDPAIALIVSSGRPKKGAPKPSGESKMPEEGESESVDPAAVAAAKRLRLALGIEDGDDEEIAKALKKAIYLCADESY